MDLSYPQLKKLCTQHKTRLPDELKCNDPRALLLTELLRSSVIETKKLSVEELRAVAEVLSLAPTGTGVNGRILKKDLLQAINDHLAQHPFEAARKVSTRARKKYSPKKEPKESPKKQPKEEPRESPKKSPKTSPSKTPLKQSPPKTPPKTPPKAPSKQTPSKQTPSKQSPRKSPRSLRAALIRTIPEGKVLANSELIEEVRTVIKEKAKTIKEDSRILKDLDISGLLSVKLRSNNESYLLSGDSLSLLANLLPQTSDRKGSVRPTLTPDGYAYEINGTNTKRLAVFLGAVREVNKREHGTTLVRDGYRNQPFGIIGYDTPYQDPQWMIDYLKKNWPEQYQKEQAYKNPVRVDLDRWEVTRCEPNPPLEETHLYILNTITELRWGDPPRKNKLLLWTTILENDESIPDGYSLAVRKVDDRYLLVTEKNLPVPYPEEELGCFTLTVARILHLLGTGIIGRSDNLLDEEVMMAQRLVNYV